MKYELDALDQLVSDIHPSTTKEQIDANEYINYKDRIISESDRIKKAFVKMSFSDRKEKHIERYFQNHQSELIRLTDRALHYLEQEDSLLDDPGEPSRISLYTHTYSYLDSILGYLEKYFVKYFNPDTNVPEGYRLITKTDLKEKLQPIKDNIQVLNLDERLMDIILAPVRALINDRITAISFKDLVYLKTLTVELEQWPDSNFKSEHPIDGVICSMVYLNYNSYKFFGFCTEHITNDYQEKESLSDQIECLSWYSKCISQSPTKPGFSYKPDRQSLKDFLLEWIDVEMSHLEKSRQLSLNISTDKAIGVDGNFKLNTSLSVAQLAYFIRILLDTKVIQNRNQKEVLKFISQFFRTKKTENISVESLRNKFYNTEASTRKGVKDVVSELLNEIKKV